MIELLLFARALRSPIEALTRRWYCLGLYRVTRGERGCRECTDSCTG